MERDEYRAFIAARGRGKDMMSMITRMAEGNPGCIAFLCELLNMPEGMKAIKTLQEFGIFGSRAYQLWNDCCNRETEKAAEILKLAKEGKITQAEICEHVFLPYGKPFDLEEIRKRDKRPAVSCYMLKYDPDPRAKGIGKEAQKMCADMHYSRLMERAFEDSEDLGKRFLISTEIVEQPDGLYLKAIKREITDEQRYI